MTFAYLVLFAWPAAVVMLFALLPPRRAVVVGFLVGCFALPNLNVPISGLPDYSKISATCVGVLGGALLFDLDSLTRFRPRLLDLPMAFWCVWPGFSGALNGMAMYSCVAAAVTQTVTWGLPYLAGRLFLSDGEGLRELAMGIVIGGLVYIPFVVFEARMSPIIHHMVYGWRSGALVIRQPELFGPFSYTPSVLSYGGYLKLTMFMGAAALIATWLWATRARARICRVSLACLAPGLWGAAILCKAWGANVLWITGGLCLLATRRLRWSVPIVLFALAPPVYMATRASGAWSGEDLTRFVREHLSERRAQSLDVRLKDEDRLAAKALLRPFWGWGPWGDFRVKNEKGTDISYCDGLWMIAMGQGGIPNVVALFAAFLLPVWVLLGTQTAAWWSRKEVAHVAAIAVLMIVYANDALFNALINPIYVLALGGLTGYVGRPEWMTGNASATMPPSQALPARGPS